MGIDVKTPGKIFNIVKLRDHFTQMLTILEINRVKFMLVKPKTWQSDLRLLSQKKESQTEKKNRHKELASRIFPDLKITHANADALLIAYYGKKIVSRI
jgi:hypothetical protein